MILFLPRFASSPVRISCGISKRVFKAAWLVGLIMVTLSSCSRVAYVFSPGSPSYLATERPAPTVLAYPQASVFADSLPAVADEHREVPAQKPAKKLWPLSARHVGGLPARVRLLATKMAAKRLTKRAAPHSPHSTARYQGTAGPSSTLIVSLCLLAAGLLGLLVGASISTNIVGAIFGIFLFVLGSIALAVGAVLLIIALVAKE
jgi:hypothetical protein